MPRKPIPSDIQERLLAESRRRCAICYGLHQSLEVKRGQIAHIDHNKLNNRSENLVFLCLEHHDQYDSTTSQSKNFTEREIKNYRYQLITRLEHGWRKGEIIPPPTSPISMVFNITNIGGSGGSGGLYGGGGGGGGAPHGSGGAGGLGGDQAKDKMGGK